MANEVTLPRLGWDMEEGALGGWLKKNGDFVNAGDLLFTVEGDKAVQEIEALDSGFLHIAPDAPGPGVKVPVGTLLGYLVSEQELASFKPGGSPGALAPALPAAPSTPPLTLASQPASNAAAPAGPSGEESVRRIYISPLARRLAESLGIDWRKVKGSGRDGRIMARDIQNAPIPSQPASAAAISPPVVPAVVESRPAIAMPVIPSIPAGRAPMAPVRRSIAEHMANSAHTVAPVTLTCEVDASQLVALRRQLKEDLLAKNGPVPSYNDMLAKIAAQALMEHPDLNTRIDGDDIVYYPSAHVAVAVDTERGLLVPVLRDVQTKSLLQVARESAVLFDKTRQGKAAYEDLQGGTFTITNLGMFEIEAFTPIINLPQCAILGVGQIIPKQVVVDVDAEKVVIQQRMALSLTFDHRLVDGAQAARFLQRIKRLIEKPFLWLVG